MVGVLFALDLSRQTTAYAVTDEELDAVLGPVVDERLDRVGRHRPLPQRLASDRSVTRPR